jgi:DNA-binding MarR family transcriptional regulator
MNAPRFATAKLLQKLSQSPVGVKEAAVLFAIVGDTSYPELADTLGISKRTAWTRIAVLKAKGLVQTKHYPLGGIYHVLTKTGRKIVTQTLDL